MRSIALILLTALALCGCVRDLGSQAPPLGLALPPAMPQGRAVDGPRGYADMCRRAPDICAADDERPRLQRISIADDRLSLLEAVNRRVNVRTRQVSDNLAFGRRELWRPAGAGPSAVGDCEDIAIEKRLELREAGFPDHELFYAVGYSAGLGLHTVLVARSGRGDVVLDSRTPYLTLWGQAPYLWVMRQSQTDPQRWVAVERRSGAATIVTSAAAEDASAFSPSRPGG